MIKAAQQHKRGTPDKQNKAYNALFNTLVGNTSQ